MHPFVVGRGGAQDLLYRDAPLTGSSLIEATTLEPGIVILDYRVTR